MAAEDNEDEGPAVLAVWKSVLCADGAVVASYQPLKEGGGIMLKSGLLALNVGVGIPFSSSTLSESLLLPPGEKCTDCGRIVDAEEAEVYACSGNCCVCRSEPTGTMFAQLAGLPYAPIVPPMLRCGPPSGTLRRRLRDARGGPMLWSLGTLPAVLSEALRRL